MNNNPMVETLFTRNHLWAKIDGGTCTVGLTAKGVELIGSGIKLTLPDYLVGKAVAQAQFDGDDPSSDPIEDAYLESDKAMLDLHSPLSGTIAAINADAVNRPELIEETPETDGWLFKVTLSDAAGEKGALLTKAQYDEFVAAL
jgi:glycine cleavage system H protein